MVVSGTGATGPVGSGLLAGLESTATARDGQVLRTLHWPATGEPWAGALLVHGLGEHAGRYDTVASSFAAAGIEVRGYDLRGFGGSAGRRAYVERWTRYHDDLEDRLAAVREARPGLPVLLYGHSMGGLIALGYVLAEPARPLPDGLVLSAPGLASAIPAWKRGLARLLTSIAPGLRLRNGLAADGLSRDPAIRAAADADPLCQDTSTVRLGAEGFAEQRRVAAVLTRGTSLPVPTYVLHGSDDPIVPVAATSILDARGNVTLRVHRGLRHECHHEPEHADVLREVIAWLEAALGRAATKEVPGVAAPDAAPDSSPGAASPVPGRMPAAAR
jgi:acylglycerol lipase